MGMDTLHGNDSMPNPPKSPLGGLDPEDLLKQGVAEDTLMDGVASNFNPPPIEELAAIFPQFQILELIGRGGMGAVYKIRQKDLDRIVALKILSPAIGQSPEFSARFTREAKALAKLNHHGIVTLHEFGQQDGLYFILMEFVDGVNLAQLIKTGRISPRQALAIVPQICDALQFAHDQGIVHRDIKPENILLDRLGRVKVADFGIAKVVASVCDRPVEGEKNQRRSQTDATLAGKIIGTPQYMAPEQIDHPADVDHRADIYALGVVFYQMLTGELPGKGFEAPSKKVHIDVRLDEIVMRAMERNPELRFQQASAMTTRVEDLDAEPRDITPIPSAAPSERRCDSFGIAAFLMAILLGPFGSLPAIIFGHVALSRIRANPLLTGRGFAMAGIIIGYLFLALVVLVIVLAFWSPVAITKKTSQAEFVAPQVIIVEEPASPSLGLGTKSGKLLDAGKGKIGGAEVAVLAEMWIVGIDSGKYSQSWKDASEFLRSAIAESAWVSALEVVRKPLGAVRSREIRENLKKATALPGAPDGEYFIIQFDTSFASKADAVETVTFKLEADGGWKAAGYFVR
jgi:serine/threonine protein kinase